jgi:thioredoxin-like negative regulator of GroEL
MKTKFILLIFFTGFLNVTMFASKGQLQNKEQETVYWKAVRYFQDENYAKAVLLFEYILDNDSDNANVNFYTGMCFFNLNKPKIANWYFTKVADDNYYRLKIKLLTRVQDVQNYLCLDF